jgi:hypothetical protein
MYQPRSNQQTGRIDSPVDESGRLIGSGPLQSRILAGSQAGATGHPDTASLAMQFATIALLDGTVIGRLECHESLGQVVVGRSSLAEIQVHDPFVHRVHFHLHWDVDLRAHVISHGGGSNGTFVNLQRVDRPTRLIDGARIRIGKTELIYRRVYYPGS